MSDDEKVRRAIEDGDYVVGVAPLLADEVKRLRADLDQTAADVMAVIDGREPETWAWPLHGLRDALDAARQRAERAEAVAAHIRSQWTSCLANVIYDTGNAKPDLERSIAEAEARVSKAIDTFTAGLAAPKETAK